MRYSRRRVTLPDCTTINAALIPRIMQLLQELLPNGRREGKELRVGSDTGERGRSLSVCLTGENAGLYFDHATGKGGNLVDLTMAVKFPGDLRVTRWWLTEWLGWTNGDGQPFTPPVMALPVSITTSNAEDARKAEWTRGMVRRLWNESTAISGTLVETYLNSRSLTAPARDVLRCNLLTPRGPGPEVEYLPAMIAPMTDPATNVVTGLHRTYLRADGAGKARGQPNKMMLGHAGVMRLTPDEDVTNSLGITEGIENALTMIQHGGHRVWACGSAGGVEKFPVLDGIEFLTIFADADMRGLQAAQECWKRWKSAGREVRIILPKDGDWNDAARRVAA